MSFIYLYFPYSPLSRSNIDVMFIIERVNYLAGELRRRQIFAKNGERKISLFHNTAREVLPSAHREQIFSLNSKQEKFVSTH